MKNIALYPLCIALAMLFAVLPSCKKHNNPTPDFSYSGTLRAGYLITFHSNVQTCVWSFGDGSKSTDPNPNHTYASAATYTVTLVPDNDTTQKITKTITIEPSFDFTYSGIPTAGYPITFTSNVPSGNTFLWNFGDGVTSTDAAPSHTFATNDPFEVSLTINNEPEHIIKKTINIFANGVYLNLIAGTKTWHHIYTSVFVMPPSQTSYPRPDLDMTITVLSPSVIIIGSDTLTYSGNINSDSVLVFNYYDYYRNINNNLHFNHFTAAIDYYQYHHLSAAAEAYDYYYTP